MSIPLSLLHMNESIYFSTICRAESCDQNEIKQALNHQTIFLDVVNMEKFTYDNYLAISEFILLLIRFWLRWGILGCPIP